LNDLLIFIREQSEQDIENALKSTENFEPMQSDAIPAGESKSVHQQSSARALSSDVSGRRVTRLLESNTVKTREKKRMRTGVTKIPAKPEKVSISFGGIIYRLCR
jgi:hypothetical protein